MVFFGNSQCLGCGTPLGYEPYLGKVVPLIPGHKPETWRAARIHGAVRRCANLNSFAACNWLLRINPKDASTETMCISCRLNRTIPDLSVQENGELWGRIETAKRRVIASLVALGLPVSRVTEDPEQGLVFDFLRSPEGGPRVITGHANGVITLNIEEADDARREQIRKEMGEPYRTLVGHFRHEVGHYYWDRLIAHSNAIGEFRQLFGDETVDYSAALRAYHAQGPQPNWAEHYISAYASSHPWEDWAETWAHYLHMLDMLGAAESFGLDRAVAEVQFEPFAMDALAKPNDPGAECFLSSLNSWVKLTTVLNELARSMGQPDTYPFALPRAEVAKLQFVDIRVQRTGAEGRATARNVS
jgi:hypothetical protein